MSRPHWASTMYIYTCITAVISPCTVHVYTMYIYYSQLIQVLYCTCTCMYHRTLYFCSWKFPRFCHNYVLLKLFAVLIFASDAQPRKKLITTKFYLQQKFFAQQTCWGDTGWKPTRERAACVAITSINRSRYFMQSVCGVRGLTLRVCAQANKDSRIFETHYIYSVQLYNVHNKPASRRNLTMSRCPL